MTGETRSPARRPGRQGMARAWAPWALLVLAAVAAALVAGPRPHGGPPLDPSSTDPDGTKALVDTLQAVGADVSVRPGPPEASSTTALLLDDTLSEADRAATSRWVRQGGTLVLADPFSALNPTKPSGFRIPEVVGTEMELDCDVPALRQVRRVVAPDYVLQRVPSGGTGCFRTGRGAWLVVVPQERGTVVVLGGGAALTNAELGKADNAVLVGALLAPTRSDRVAVVAPAPPGSGRKTLGDLVSDRAKLAMLQLAVAFVVVVLWRARRLGRPVLEPQPVELAGSELVGAVGNLLQRARGRNRAAETLRNDLRRFLGERLGLPAGLSAEQVADVVAARVDVRAERVRRVLDVVPPPDEAGLVALAQEVEAVRREVAGGA